MNLKLIKYIFTALILLGMASCSSEDIPYVCPSDSGSAYIDGDNVIISVALDASDMLDIKTRGMVGDIEYEDMSLYLVEFDDNGSPLRNTLKTVYTPTTESPEESLVKYKVVLTATAQPRILHLIALPKSKELNIEYGIEAVVIPNLKTEGATPAYWRRLSFPNGYVTEGTTREVTTELSQLYHVALIRNFSCISVDNQTADNINGGQFTLTGFAIVNDPTAGTIAPWKSSDYSFPSFLDADQTPVEFTDLHKVYSGIIPAGVSFSNPEAGPIVDDDISPKYMYERPFNSIRHTYIIIKGRRNGDEKDYYYKLDLGANDASGIFKYYSILRNYNYKIILKGVAAKGYDTALEAARGVVYNNFSFDIELSSMLNISDGNEIVYVNFTTAVLTDPEAQILDFKYRYRSLSSSSPTYNNEGVNFIGLEPGDVIDKVEFSTSDEADGWRNVRIYCKPAQTETKTQSFTIVKPTGLGRTINLILHRKWTLQNVKEFLGVLENWNDETPDEGEVGDKIGSEFTIFFDVPDNLEEAMFPLVFTLEADRQNMDNNPLGALVVTSGPSGFPGVVGTRIKYEKSVSWTQYNDPLKEGDPYDNGTAINNTDGTVTHRVRCRFRTTTDLSNLPFDQSTTRVLITNDNFNNAIVTFNREI